MRTELVVGRRGIVDQRFVGHDFAGDLLHVMKTEDVVQRRLLGMLSLDTNLVRGLLPVVPRAIQVLCRRGI